MNLEQYKHIFEIAFRIFINNVSSGDVDANIDMNINIEFSLNTYVFQFKLKKGRQIFHTENQVILINSTGYPIEHIFMKQNNIFYIYSFFCSCSYGLIEGHLLNVYFDNESIYDYYENIHHLEVLQLSSDDLHIDLITEDPLYFPFGTVQLKRKRIEENEDYDAPAKLVFK